MESIKGVIKITKLSDINGYDQIYYFTGIIVNNDGHININYSGNVWEAMKFNWNSSNNAEVFKIQSLITFIENCLLPKKKFKVEISFLNLTY